MQTFARRAAEQLAPVLELPAEEIAALFQRPPRPEMGDLALPCFPLAKTQRRKPQEIAAEIAETVPTGALFDEIRVAGPFVNFVLGRSAIVEGSVEAVMAEPGGWGCSADGAGRTVLLEFSSPNIAKPLGVHHIRSTMIGAALGRLYEATGWTVIRINHLGDWGTNFGQLMVSYKKAQAEHPDVPVDIHALLDLYVRYHADAEADESLGDAAREWFRKLEEGDEEAVRLWKVFVDESLKSLKALYARLGVDFDHYTGESFFKDRMAGTVRRLEEANLLTESEGAQVVDLEPWEMPPCLIRKRDGSTLYATRDLAAAEYRHEEYRFDRCLYVVGNQQELHFRQIFKVLALMGYDWAEACEHVKFGMLAFGKGVFGDDAVTGSTRKGQVVFLEDVLDRAAARAKEIIVENAREDAVTAKADALAESVGVGAVIFNEFLQRRMKDVLFTWEKALNLQGDSGPYLQYTHARLSSVLRRYGRELPETIDWSRLESPLEREVMMQIAAFPDAVGRATGENEPSLVAHYLLELAGAFNRMFTDKERHRIVGEDAELSAARAGLVECVRVTLANGLALLGLDAPDRM